MHEVARELDRWVAEGGVPSASIAVRVGGVERLHHTVGRARLAPARPATPDQVYDLASVTKALAGATVAASLLQEGRLGLDDLASRWTPCDRRITVAHLLTHGSGLPAWRPLYEEVPRASWGSDQARDRIVELAATTPLQAEPGAAHTYSDLGFLTLLGVLEQVGGDRLDALLAPILERAGVALSWGCPGAAATEDCPVRGEVVEGRVHDLNAFALGGISTHAGLFGDARSVAALADGLLDAVQGRRADLPGRGLARLWALRGPGSHRGGWDGVTRGGYTSTGQWWPDDGLGHLGYTGTSLWLAPRQRVVVALLTNRVHPVDDKGPIRAGRPRIHDAVARALGWDTAPP